MSESSLGGEFRDGGTTDYLKDFKPMGWYWNGELHAMEGFHLVEYGDGCTGIEKDE